MEPLELHLLPSSAHPPPLENHQNPPSIPPLADLPFDVIFSSSLG